MPCRNVIFKGPVRAGILLPRAAFVSKLTSMLRGPCSPAIVARVTLPRDIFRRGKRHALEIAHRYVRPNAAGGRKNTAPSRDLPFPGDWAASGGQARTCTAQSLRP